MTFLTPDASGSSIFFGQVLCLRLAMKVLQLSRFFITTRVWRDASTSSPTVELQVSFYFMES